MMNSALNELKAVIKNDGRTDKTVFNA